MNDRPSADARRSALSIVRTLRAAGFTAYWAGGCVRDMLMGRPPKDYDIATTATPDEVAALFPKTVAVGKAFGVIQVHAEGATYEVATFRREADYADGRRPSSVAFCAPEEDARRRDFTINGLFYDPVDETVLDFVGGRADIEARIIRTIGRPEERLGEDYLRMLRAARLAAVLEFAIEPGTADAVRRSAALLTRVSAERIQQELTRLLMEAPRAGQGLVLLRELGLLSIILPEVDAMHGQEQPEAFHPEGDVFTHTVKMLDTMEERSVPLAYAVLLHDVAKPLTACRTIEDDGSERIRFNNHARLGADVAGNILRRLKLPSRVIEDVVEAIGNHMRFMDVQRMRPATLRRLVGAPTFAMELELHRLDCLASHGDLSNYEYVRRFAEELEDEPALPAPWITGHDLMALGLAEGPEVGRWHRRAYEAQLEGRFPDRDALLEWVRTQLAQVDGET